MNKIIENKFVKLNNNQIRLEKLNVIKKLIKMKEEQWKTKK
jgi:hypothetical protein